MAFSASWSAKAICMSSHSELQALSRLSDIDDLVVTNPRIHSGAGVFSVIVTERKIQKSCVALCGDFTDTFHHLKNFIVLHFCFLQSDLFN